MRLFEYVEQGGVIMYILVLLNIVGLSILIWKSYIVYDFKKRAGEYSNQLLEKFKNGIGGSGLSEPLQLDLLKDEISNRMHTLEVGLNTVKIIASIAPLLGLLGTVLGILSAFTVIAREGMSNPSLFAGGISMALVTTVGGLIVAIPHFIGHNYIVGVLDNLEVQLEQDLVPKAFGQKGDA